MGFFWRCSFHNDGCFGSSAQAQWRTACQIQGFFKAAMQTCSNIQNWWNHFQRYWIQFYPLAPTCPSLLFHSKWEIYSYHSSEWPTLTNPALSRSTESGDLHRSLPTSAGSQVCDFFIFFRSLSDLLFLWVMLKELQVGIFPQYFQASHHIEEKSVFIYLQLREETGNVTVIGNELNNWEKGKMRKRKVPWIKKGLIRRETNGILVGFFLSHF